jgi:hypothetical protein
MKRSVLVVLVLGAALAAAPSPAFAEFWPARSGSGRIALHTDLVRTLGIEAPSAVLDADGRLSVPLRLSGRLELFAPRSLFRDLAGGEIRLESPAVLRLGDAEVPLEGITVRRGPEERTLALVGSDGRPLFEGDQMHFTVDRDAGRVRLFNIDLRLTAESAALVGEARFAGVAVGVLELTLDAAIPPGEPPEPSGACTSPSWGAPSNDVALINIGSVQQPAREGSFPTGRIAVVPSAMLKNVGTTDVPWHPKFSGTFPPYGNDQHPFLVWNMYRIANGAIEQIGRSPLKHAFLTLNTACGCPTGNILWASCEDTYGSGTNDSLENLGPREELTAHTGVWERCHSLFDPDCNGMPDAAPLRASPMDRRMAVAESDLRTPGAAYYVDAWYVVRDDANIFNTMGHRRVTPAGGATWTFSLSGYPFSQGPAIDEWVDPDAPGPGAESVLLDTAFGRMKLAVRATDLGGGQWRYDYALMNLDFDPRVKMFSVPLPPGSVVTDVGFHDADRDPANDWIVTVSRRIAWRAPSAAATQDYSTLLSFHFTVNAAPTAVDGSSAKLRSLEARALVIEPRLLGPGVATARPATRSSRSRPG